MSPTDYDRYYVRHLPHVHPESATFFVTYRLANSLPPQVRSALLQEAEADERRIADSATEAERERITYLLHRKAFGRWDAALDNVTCGPSWLQDARIAEIVANSLHFREGEQHDLIAFCIMPNHIHVVLTPLPDANAHFPSLTTIMQSIKGYTARKANRILGHRGQFWQHESYDHWIRDEHELQRVVQYVINNPVKAQLVDHWSDWKWTYCKHES